ncbi:citrate lyase holo-[acyl-carrier protein] synthase [Pisciglobus halotolerans]|uniref:citrate lyase holo-[acyl-carrier protein] synthase n=1 Tax=Pisciglobus halotolerans TaxID=745365 RepID=A0A1I3BP05_9LACT|nr:citrate lyase holo-[acyl-carrier protein] synthase [Pisciglobus halotolerans]SFH64002.1 holo-ACP synthase [Pisciglobus halotolerans]
MDLFNSGKHVSLEEVLENREKRAFFQQKLLERYSGSLVSFNCNIPGPIKNNPMIKQIFDVGKSALMIKLRENKVNVLMSKEWDNVTGPELFLVADIRPSKLKKLTVQIEETTLGRLFDMDVLFKETTEQIRSVNRQELGLPVRKCFVCEDEAKNCGRSRKHSLEEIFHSINKMLEQEETVLY